MQHDSKKVLSLRRCLGTDDIEENY